MKADSRRIVRGIVCSGSRLEDAIDDAAKEMHIKQMYRELFAAPVMQVPVA